MTTILLVLALGLVTWSATLLAGRLPRAARLPLALGVMLGLTGYLLAGRPGVPGATVARAAPPGFGEALTDPRRGMARRFGPDAQWLGLSDGLLRNGNSLGAARLLEQGLRRNPRSVDLWVGYGNALLAHSGGVSTPASERAFATAAAIDPGHPAPPFFAGLAQAQGGERAAARRTWAALLARTPQGAPWRADLVAGLAELDRAPGAPEPPPTPAIEAR